MVVLAGVQRLLSDPVTLMLCVIPLIIHNLMVCLRTVYPGLCKPTPRPGRATLHAGKRDRAADTAAQRSFSGETTEGCGGRTRVEVGLRMGIACG